MTMRPNSSLSDTNRRVADLFKAAPGPMRAFSSLAESAAKDGEISSKYKELICVAISIALRCEDCIAYHLSAALEKGAKRQEVVEIISVAIEMGGGPSVVYGARALEIFDAAADAISR